MSKTKEAPTPEVEGGDNILDMLDDFNTPESSPEQPEQEAESQQAEEQPEESVEAEEAKPEQASVEEPPTVEEEARWLIEGKFKDTEEGREKLAKSYKEMQSLRDKDRQQYEKEIGTLKPLQELDTFLKETPEAVDAIQNVVQKEKKALAPPQQPEDFDQFEIFTEGTSSNKWFNEMMDFRENRGAQKALQQISAKEQQSSQLQQLKEEGLSDEEIQDYTNFWQSDKNVNSKNMVGIWRYLNGKTSDTGSDETLPEKNQRKLPKVDKNVSGASVTGSVPTPKPAKDKAVEEFWGGIMEFSKS